MIGFIEKDENDILHYGIKGKSGRYPLGSGDRPYQRMGGKKSSGFFTRMKKSKTKGSKEEKEPLDPEEAKRKHEEDKQRAIKTGTATELMRFKGELTNQEYKEAIDRLNYEKNLKSLSQNEMDKAIDNFDRTMKKVKTVTDWVKIGTESYNTLARLYNATDNGKENPWTLIKMGDQPKKQK